MTDIVERLRNRALAATIIKGSPALYNDAADVIISLCAENEQLREALKRAADRDEERRRPIRLIGSEAAARKALGETDG